MDLPPLEKTTLLIVSQVILTNTNQRASGGFNNKLFEVSFAGLMTSLAMAHNQVFSCSIVYRYIGIFGFPG